MDLKKGDWVMVSVNDPFLNLPKVGTKGEVVAVKDYGAVSILEVRFEGNAYPIWVSRDCLEPAAPPD